METRRQGANSSGQERHFREQSDNRQDEPVKKTMMVDTEILIYTTDEPGGDPYNHTGRFKRMYR